MCSIRHTNTIIICLLFKHWCVVYYELQNAMLLVRNTAIVCFPLYWINNWILFKYNLLPSVFLTLTSTIFRRPLRILWKISSLFWYLTVYVFLNAIVCAFRTMICFKQPFAVRVMTSNETYKTYSCYIRMMK